jgi:putative membrane protein
MERKDNTYRISLIVLIATYLVGIIGFQMEIARPYFIILTPFHLMLTAYLLIINSKEDGYNLGLFVFSSATIGYIVEVIGVKSGFIFGNYNYGSTLGLKILDVPLMIGVNWFILTFCVGITAMQFIKNSALFILASSVSLVGIDFLIEPVAIKLYFWSWSNGIIPLHNYFGWFFTSVLILSLFRLFRFTKPNPFAIYVLLAQIIFFLILGQGY